MGIFYFGNIWILDFDVKYNFFRVLFYNCKKLYVFKILFIWWILGFDVVFWMINFVYVWFSGKFYGYEIVFVVYGYFILSFCRVWWKKLVCFFLNVWNVLNLL